MSEESGTQEEKLRKCINKEMLPAMITAMEWGFIAHECGMNLELAKEKFIKIIEGRV